MRIVLCIWLFALPLTGTAKPSLHERVIQGDIDEVAQAIKPKKLNKLDKKGNAAIHYAAARANPEIVSLLIESGASVNVVNKKYQTTPLHELARTVEKNRKRIRETARLLLSNGADPWLVDGHGESSLFAAARAGNSVVVKVVLEAGDADAHEVKQALLAAREHGRYPVIRLLESRGVKSDSGKDTGLLNAATLGNYAMVDNLVTGGANLESKIESGDTPLILAAEGGHTEVVRYLLEHRADVSSKANNGKTALHAAAERGDMGTIKLLLSHKADINTESQSLGTPINRAAKGERLNVVNFLLEQGGKPYTLDTDAEEAFGSGLGWLLYAEYHDETAPKEVTQRHRAVAKEMLGIANTKFEEQLQNHEKLRRREKRSEAITDAMAVVVATAAVVGLEKMRQDSIRANRRQTAQIMALSDATSYNDYHRRFRLYESAMINPVVQSPYQIDFTDTSLANTESISGLDVIITEYERRIALTNKLLEGVP